jgi:hypothetical protein
MSSTKKHIECRAVRLRGRSGWRLANRHIEMHWLAGGGLLATLSRRTGAAANQNLIWESAWPIIEPHRYSEKKHGARYGGGAVAQMLSGYTGHALCLDYFGAPSPTEEALGLPLHGEAGTRRWLLTKKFARDGQAQLSMRDRVPSAGLTVERDITLRENESVAYVTETVANKNNRDRYFQWVQHATFGPPFLKENESVVAIPGTQSKTSPDDYGGHCALATDQEFTWPHAPAHDGGTQDISQPFSRKRRGFVATTLLGGGANRAAENDSPFTYVAVLNWKLGLIAGYIFRRADFPWAAIWEENHSRANAPWHGTTQARGLEFGNTPLPLGLQHAINAGPLFGAPTAGRVPAAGRVTASYAIFAAEVPQTWKKISSIDVRPSAGTSPNANVSPDAIVITGPQAGDQITLPATHLAELWPTAK